MNQIPPTAGSGTETVGSRKAPYVPKRFGAFVN